MLANQIAEEKRSMEADKADVSRSKPVLFRSMLLSILCCQVLSADVIPKKFPVQAMVLSD